MGVHLPVREGRGRAMMTARRNARVNARRIALASARSRRRAWRPSPLASWHPGDLPASPSAPPLRCPGAVTPRAVPLTARSQPRPLPRPWPRILRQPSCSPAMPPSEDRWRPACRPLATARSRRVTFHLYKGTERRRTVAAGNEEKLGRSVQRRSETALRRRLCHRTGAQIVPGPPDRRPLRGL